MLSLRCRINANVAELLVIIVYTGLGPLVSTWPRHIGCTSLPLSRASRFLLPSPRGALYPPDSPARLVSRAAPLA